MDATPTFFDLKSSDINGSDFAFQSLKGKKATLVVNVACECGLTPQYAGLSKLYKDHQQEGLEILGFPCNQFGAQEPGTLEEIKEFVKQFDVTFTLFNKISVNGAETDPVYAFLKKNSSLFNAETGVTGDIPWNFAKFLVDSNGTVQYFGPKTTPEELEAPIKTVLAGGNSQ